MLFAALRDMQWRKRRLIIAVVSTGLIFGMTLVMTGLMNGFRVEGFTRPDRAPRSPGTEKASCCAI
jgi:hypothetical protein